MDIIIARDTDINVKWSVDTEIGLCCDFHKMSFYISSYAFASMASMASMASLFYVLVVFNVLLHRAYGVDEKTPMMFQILI